MEVLVITGNFHIFFLWGSLVPTFVKALVTRSKKAFSTSVGTSTA